MNTIYWQVGVMIGVMSGVTAALIGLFGWAFSRPQSAPTSGHTKRCLARLNEFDPFSE